MASGSKPSRVFAIVPAAGKSRRMGVPKLSLPLGAHTVLEHVVEALLAAPLDEVVVVVGPSGADLRSHIRPPAQCLLLDHDTVDMRHTVAAGLAWLRPRRHPGDRDAFLLALADQPTLSTEVIARLVAAHSENPTQIRLPSFAGRRGHPVLFPWSLTPTIDSLADDEGLNVVVRRYGDRVAELVVSDASVLDDLDVPADYARLQRHFASLPPRQSPKPP